jgi:hypothetical protein
VPKEEIRPAKKLAEEIFKKTYEKNFSDVKIESSVPAAKGSIDGHETRLSMTHTSMGAIKKRERVLVKDEHVLILSAEGKSEVFERMEQDVDKWFARSSFAALG